MIDVLHAGPLGGSALERHIARSEVIVQVQDRPDREFREVRWCQYGIVPTNDGNEPLGQRIIELPENLERTELRDAASGFVAYVPVGSIKKGEALVTKGGGKTTQCGLCHGADLKGLGPVPGIGGRSPSYLVRQMHDMQTGVRKGSWSELMKPVVEKERAHIYEFGH